MIERYHSPQLNGLFEYLFLNGAIEHEEQIFTQLVSAGVLRETNPHILALRFYIPIFYLLQKYDLRPEAMEEAKKELNLMVQEFCETYKSEAQ